jgi:hypothetical protein
MADSSTVEFINEHFKKLPSEKEALKFDLLELLARYKTDHSYSVLKNLLIEHTPGQKGNKELSYRVTDSLSLARKLFPEILKLSNNNLFAERIIAISRNLIDSNLISYEMLLPYKVNFLYTADTILATLKKAKEEFYGYQYLDMLHLLAGFNDEKCNQLLQKYLLLNSLMVKQEALIGLLKNKQVIPPAAVEKLAADKSYRRDIYDNLKKINKSGYYPAKYRTQQHLAESDIYNYAYSEDEPTEMNYIGERTVLYKGKKHRFYLYKLVYSYESEESDEMEEHKYLGIAGPFSIDLKTMEKENNVTGLFYDDEYDPKKIDKQLSSYLKSIEKKDISR